MRITASLVLVGLLATTASAVITLVPEARTELLYSTSKDIDCTELHAITDSALLPFNVVRLRALNDGAPIDLSTVKLQWSFKGKALGSLAADLDLGPTGDLPTVTAMCANFGNECALADDRLKVYDRDTIFYVAPSCEDLVRDPKKPFSGGSAKIRVKATQGGRKLGKADVTIGYGRNGGVTLFVQNTSDDFVNGIGRVVTTYVITDYAAQLEQPNGITEVPTSYNVSGDVGSVELGIPCGFGGYEACASLEQSGGGGTALLTAKFEDGSALCDNISVVIALCNPDGVLEVVPRPKRGTYDPANPSQNLVDLDVRLHNTSKPGNGLPACPFLMGGQNIASCSSTLKVGDFEETKTSSFSLPHCSKSTEVSCQSSAECAPPECEDCEADERCLLGPYCSTTVGRDCMTDADCAPPSCPECQVDEICVHMLDFPPNTSTFIIAPGERRTIVSGVAALRNRFKSTASLTDTWTVNVRIPNLTFAKSIKYKIRGRPQ